MGMAAIGMAAIGMAAIGMAIGIGGDGNWLATMLLSLPTNCKDPSVQGS
jgi:hypothetical protein